MGWCREEEEESDEGEALPSFGYKTTNKEHAGGEEYLHFVPARDS